MSSEPTGNVRLGILKPDPTPAADHAFQIVSEGVLKSVPVFRHRVAKQQSFLVAICSTVLGVSNVPSLCLNPFCWSMLRVDLFPADEDREGLDADALVEALRGEHDLRDGFKRIAAVKNKDTDNDSASYFSFIYNKGVWTYQRLLRSGFFDEREEESIARNGGAK